MKKSRLEKESIVKCYYGFFRHEYKNFDFLEISVLDEMIFNEISIALNDVRSSNIDINAKDTINVIRYCFCALAKIENRKLDTKASFAKFYDEYLEKEKEIRAYNYHFYDCELEDINNEGLITLAFQRIGLILAHKRGVIDSFNDERANECYYHIINYVAYFLLKNIHEQLEKENE